MGSTDSESTQGLTLSDSVSAADWIAGNFSVTGPPPAIDSISARVMSVDRAGAAGKSANAGRPCQRCQPQPAGASLALWLGSSARVRGAARCKG